MTIECVREALRSDQPAVVVEAPAGCGKTFEAALLASDLATTLSPGRQILLLAHTNAAVQEFSRHTECVGRAVRVATIDSFCLHLLEPYAACFDFPVPLHRHVGPGTGRIDFAELAPKAAEMLRRCPRVSRVLGIHYPMIILDEHQDARPDQHEVARRIAEAGGSRLRIFGDPMQAIYERHGTESVNWEDVVRESGGRLELITPHRWNDAPELGRWIMLAREALQAGRRLPLEELPQSVRVTRVSNMADAQFGRILPNFVSGPLHRSLDRAEGRVAVLTYSNRAVRDIDICAAGRLVINEGADFERAYIALEQASAAAGSPQQLAGVLMDLVQEISIGLDAGKRTTINNGLQRDRIIHRSRVVGPLLNCLERLYERPTPAGFCAAAGAILDGPPEWLSIRLPGVLRVLSRIRPHDDNPFEALDATIAAGKLRPFHPTLMASTVHKSKGMEFDHVCICPFSASHFPNNDFGRRLIYVALSRARRTIEIIAPGLGPSPLLGP